MTDGAMTGGAVDGLQIRRGSADIAGVTIAYREAGDPAAPPVVLLHGGASRAATWDRVAAALVARGRRTIAADLRGHGGSSRTPDYPLRGFRDDILGLLDALAIGHTALVGHSLGGHTALLMAREQPDRFTRLVLEEPPVPSPEPSNRHGLSSARFLLPALAALGGWRGYDPRAVISAVRQLRVPDPGWWDRLPAVTAPALLVSGGPSSHVPPRRLGEVAAAVRDGRLVTIPVGHRVHSLAPERFRDAAVPFLTG